MIEINVSNQIYEIVGMVIFCIAVLLIQWCMMNSFENYYREKPMQISEFKKLNLTKQDIKYRQYVNEYKEKYVGRAERIRTWKNWFTDKMLVQSGIVAIIVLVFLLFGINIAESEGREKISKFELTNVAGISYVILYQDR